MKPKIPPLRIAPLFLTLAAWLCAPHIAKSFYNPTTGRWLNRDPSGERGGLSLYALAANDAQQRLDPLGLDFAEPIYPGMPIEIPPGTPGWPPPAWGMPEPKEPVSPDDPCAKFDAWYEEESKKGTNWMTGLPNCPCTLAVRFWACSAGAGTIITVSSDQGAGWALDAVAVALRRGAAKWCIRSDAIQSGARQECCYSSDGKLITGGAGAGTTDRSSGPMGHWNDDYLPSKWATQCHAKRDNNDCIRRYLELRPINNGNSCPKNEPRPRPR